MEQCPSSKKYKCDEDGCNKSFSRPWRLEAHNRWHKGERIFKCEEANCDKSFVTKQHLQRHKLTYHEIGCSSKDLICNITSTDATVLPLEKKKKSPAETDTAKSFACIHCSRSFKKHQQLKIHEFEHTGVKPFSCDVCQKSFLLPSKLKVHQKTHSGYPCGHENCSEVFSIWSDLTAHRKAMHRRIYTCDTCGKTFKNKGNLRGHVAIHLEEREKYTCPFEDCGKSYFRTMELRLHVSKVHEGVRDVCPFEGCGKTFSWKARLRRHMRVHDPDYQPKPKTKRNYKNKKTRFDKGVARAPTKSMLSLLTGLNLSYEDNQKLLCGEKLEINVPMTSVSVSESDTDRSM